MLENRIKLVLPYLIGPQQTGFMQGRQITDNIVKTIDVITFANMNSMNRCNKILIMTIDFEKCFDRIAYSAIFGSLRHFGFGEKYIEMIRLLFTQLKWECKMQGTAQKCL